MGSLSCGKFFPGGSSSTSSTSGSGGTSGGGLVFVANRGSQNISSFSIDSTSGALTAVVGSPFAVPAAPNLIAVNPQNTFLFAGLSSNGVEVFSVNSSGVLSESSIGGSGTFPLALAITPNGSLLYVLDKLSSTVSTFTISSSGALTAAKGTALPSGTTPQSGLVIDSAGAHIYAALGTSGIFSGTINSNGSLSQTATAAAPSGVTLQNLAITPSGSFLYALDPNNGVAAYSVGSSGLTLLNNGNLFAAGTAASAIAVDPASKIVVVANSGSTNVSSFTVNSDGTLTAVAGSPFAASSSPQSLAFDHTGKFLYVSESSGIQVFTLDSTTEGKLDAGTAVTAGTTPAGIAATH